MLLDCRRPKGTELPKLWHLDTASFSTVIAAGSKAGKGQHGVGLTIKEEVVKKDGADGIAIESISARLLKAQISVISNSATFVVAYAPTEEAPERQKAKYIATLNCTVASVPAREYVFVLTDVNARTGKRGDGGEEADSKVLGAHV